MTDKIECIYNHGYQLKQYYKNGWKCELENGVPMTILVEVTDMYDATGEEEFKDYSFVFSIGLINKNINQTILNKVVDGDDFTPSVSDVIGYYGMNCYIDQALIDTDLINQKLINELKINDACLSTYKCRFTGQDKTTIRFKTENAAFDFAEMLINSYGDTMMTLIGFTLDKRINLAGETGWKQTELFETGIE